MYYQVFLMFLVFFFFFNDTATTEIYTLSLHDALPIFLLNKSKPSITKTSKGFLLLLEKPYTTKELIEFLQNFWKNFDLYGWNYPIRPEREIGRAHVWTPVTWPSRMPSSAWKKKKKNKEEGKNKNEELRHTEVSI